jgi:hypothetical protein
VHFLVIDTRLMVVRYVFLTRDPAGDADYPGLPVHWVTLLRFPDGTPLARGVAGSGGGPHFVVGRYRAAADVFRVFDSDRSVAEAGYSLVPSSYVGDSWESYARETGPEEW